MKILKTLMVAATLAAAVAPAWARDLTAIEREVKDVQDRERHAIESMSMTIAKVSPFVEGSRVASLMLRVDNRSTEGYRWTMWECVATVGGEPVEAFSTVVMRIPASGSVYQTKLLDNAEYNPDMKVNCRATLVELPQKD
jgi:hypothetical protein